MFRKNKKGLKIVGVYLICATFLLQAQGAEEIENELRVCKLITEQFYQELTQAENINDPMIREQRLKTVIGCLEKETLKEEELTEKLKQNQLQERANNERHVKAMLAKEGQLIHP